MPAAETAGQDQSRAEIIPENAKKQIVYGWPGYLIGFT
jgi:hypothetical protein